MFNFNGKVAYVTGASSGIGRSTALHFARSGAKVALCDVSIDAGEHAAAQIKRETGAETVFLRCDVSKKGEVERSLDQTLERFGRVDFAFNNAGIEGTPGATADITEDQWDRILGINLKGVWLGMKYQIPQMLKQGGGAIVNCSSVAGLVGLQGIAAYSASKHGVIGLTRSAALDYAKQGIRINAVCPGVIATPMVERFVAQSPQASSQLIAAEPIGRMGRPDEIAAAVLWLCSSEASFVTGHAMAVDGGWVAQ